MPDERNEDWNEQDFVPRNEADPVEDLRRYVMRRFHERASQSEIEGELIAQGYEPEFAIALVCSVRTTGNYGDLIAGTTAYAAVAGVPVSLGYLQDPLYGKRVRAEQRRLRREREAMGEIDEARPDLHFDNETSPKIESAKYRRHARRQLVLVFGLVFFWIAMFLLVVRF